MHITRMHNTTKEDYLAQYGGQIKCDSSTKKYSDQNKINCDWISRAKENGDDLSEYRVKMGEAVSKAILSNPQEIARRSKLMGDLNKTDEARARASRTARITSKRPEILEQRSINLKRWRDENPEIFQEIIQKMIASKSGKSKPQLMIFEKVCKLFPDHEFVIDTQVLLKTVTALKTCRPIIDILSRKKKIAIEIDGPYHFKSINNSPLQKQQLRDQQVNAALVQLGYCVIRASYDTWKCSGEVRDEHFDQMQVLITNPRPGLHFFGNQHAGEIETAQQHLNIVLADN